MRRLVTAAAAGLLFGVGLVVSGMTDPRNVLGFLDVTGAFNPALVAVMIGAIGVHATLLRLLAGPAPRARPVSLRLGGVDRSLVLGAAIFGIGWGLSGYCPGPAVVALGFGAGGAFAFVGALLAGTTLAELVLSPRRGNAAGAARSQSPTRS